MTVRHDRDLVGSDLHRPRAQTGPVPLLRHPVVGGSTGALQYVLWVRTCGFAVTHALPRLTRYPVSRTVLRHDTDEYGFDTPHTTSIGHGPYTGHCGGSVVHDRAVIGDNCNLSQQVTLGQADRAPPGGHPVIGDDGCLGPGARLVGAVRIGDDVAIGADSVVLDDVPDRPVVVGVPARVVRLNGAAGYVEDTGYPRAAPPVASAHGSPSRSA
ncbi:serine O-acetyltransferase [Geodermatophilus dictyosporus]|uniref:Serine O-acetyltransferase n=1 Tax=Geodermatophilus dictyosporus TaxID=1523247 RepID=A0A1I5JWA5_9ACTN|nr:hypothetical protein [Geodermatophilus dictyosporus]SFO77055.1 serine O-acetyltransferase [Geodermatophilus dictyosporus]